MPSRFRIFHPLLVLFFSLAGAGLYAGYASFRFSGDKLASQYFYVVPIVVPFVAFLCERAERLSQFTVVTAAVDVFAVGVAMWRVIGNVPFISGHTLFLTYALLTARSRVCRITAAIVMLEVLYLKFIFWHDAVTPLGGILLGLLAAFFRHRSELQSTISDNSHHNPQ